MTLRINSARKFYNTVNASKGDVFLVLDNQNRIDLKKDDTAREMLLLMKPGQDVTVHVTNSDDLTSFMSYMLYAGFEDRAA